MYKIRFTSVFVMHTNTFFFEITSTTPLIKKHIWMLHLYTDCGRYIYKLSFADLAA